MTPKVSVIIPMFNCEKYVGLAIETVLAQTFRDFELILIDDASTDRTLEVAKQFDDSRIRIIESENNLGGVKVRASSEISGWSMQKATSSTPWMTMM